MIKGKQRSRVVAASSPLLVDGSGWAATAGPMESELLAEAAQSLSVVSLHLYSWLIILSKEMWAANSKCHFSRQAICYSSLLRSDGI